MTTDSLLVEICCFCGFVHRMGAFFSKEARPHFHWSPLGGEAVLKGDVDGRTGDSGELLVHATVCANHFGPEGAEYFAYRRTRLDKKYERPGRLNAGIDPREGELLDKAGIDMNELDGAYARTVARMTISGPLLEWRAKVIDGTSSGYEGSMTDGLEGESDG